MAFQMLTKVKIRGIYSSALTRLLLDEEYTIVDPSPRIQERFAMARPSDEPEILVNDLRDHQGIYLTGDTEKVLPVLRRLQGRLLDAVLMGLEYIEEPEGQLRAQLELPGSSKETLDKIRSAVAPTLRRHHRLRIVHPKGLDRAERHLLDHPERKGDLERDLFQAAILMPLQKAGQASLRHIRISGRRVRPREGLLMEADENRILLKRSFSKGRYNGLGLPIEESDYGLTEAQEGSWFVKHAYYSRQDDLKGEYFNINTPVEFYPHGARYVDLEVDVVRRAGEAPFVVDRDKLANLVKEGFIGAALEKKAMEVVEDLLQRLKS